MFANVSFPISSFKIFTYHIPKKLENYIVPGVCVNALMNRRKQTGFVVALEKECNFKGKIHPLDSLQDATLHLPPELWQTLEWVSHYYITPLGQVLKAAVPNSFLKEYLPKQIQFAKITDQGRQTVAEWGQKKPAQKRILKALSQIDELVKVSSLSEFSSSPHTICHKLEAKGLIAIQQQAKITDPYEIMGPGEGVEITLSQEQQQVFDNIKEKESGFQPFLLHGVTGSGKTEVYLKLAQKTVKSGKSVLVLVPEIALTPQVANRFRKAFGSRVALWHSRMTKAEKGWTWQRLKKGEYQVVVGARSAVFAPLQNLGLIIVDEEQETSYKQESPAPRYHARDVALMRGKNANAVVLLTSATPSLESYYNSLQKKLTLLKLSKRYGNSTYPAVELIDMKAEAKEGRAPLLSSALKSAIQKRLADKEQIIILQNRRGYSTVQQCMDCGEIKNCKYCSVSMTFHRTDNALHCHYCEYTENIAPNCPDCASGNIRFVGSGTQKVEDLLMQDFPAAEILRMDMDTVKGKDAHRKILEDFAQGRADILLGTQMIAKGLDFDNVTLVGVINADSGLFFPDFRAGEKVFQLIYQVAGRAGRREKPGKAIIQTYNPQDVYIQNAAALNTHKFYNIALAQRQELNYPPFSRIGRILFTGPHKDLVNHLAIKTSHRLMQDSAYKVLGPSPAPLERIQNNWRTHLIIKTKDRKSVSLHPYIHRQIGHAIFERKWKGVRIQVDIDPVSML